MNVANYKEYDDDLIIILLKKNIKKEMNHIHSQSNLLRYSNMMVISFEWTHQLAQKIHIKYCKT